jgi:hypothetical protein
MPTLWSRVGRRPKSQDLVSSTVQTLYDVVSKYDIVEVAQSNDGTPYIIAADRPAEKQLAAVPGQVTFVEMGSSSPSPFTSFLREEYNPKLRGQLGYKIFDQMRKSDGTVGGTLRQIKTPVLGARWFVEAASDSKRDQQIADFVWKCLTEYMTISWTQVLSEALLMLDFGYYMFEKVYDVRVIKGQPRIVWQKLAPRHPMDVKEWHLDANGGPASVTMYGTNNLLNDVTIPIDKLLVFSFQREGGNIQGVSALRTAYKHWYYKEQLYKIDAIQKERHGIGIPVVHLPTGFTPKDVNMANELGENLRTNERAHVVLPPNWVLEFAKLEGQPVDALKSIDHHDARIRETILAKFLSNDVVTQDIDQNMFMKATRFIADLVRDSFNMYAIPQLVDYNFTRLPNGYPMLKYKNIGEDEDQRTFSFTVRNLVGAGVIVPDDRLEAYVREYLDLPKIDEATRRQPATPQVPGEGEDPSQQSSQSGRAGQPRQRPVGANGLPRSNSGVDRSGGQ